MAQTDRAGRFTIRNVPTGFEVVSASAPGYNDGSGTADEGPGDDSPEVTIRLEKGKQAVFDTKTVKVGEAITLNDILFEQGGNQGRGPTACRRHKGGPSPTSWP